MSFAQSLKKKSDAAVAEKQRKEEEEKRKEMAEVKTWVDNELAKFKKVCEQRSAACQFDAEYKTDRILSCRIDGPGKDRDLRMMKAAIKTLGFSSATVQADTTYRLRFTDFILKIGVSWKACKDGKAEEPPKKRARGATQACGICAETKAMVVLAPCGHVMCEACNEKKPKNECPFCREDVLCVTNGLFMAGA